MDQKDILIELIDDFIDTVDVKHWYSEELDEHLADHILADGWMRPPVNVGQTVWFIRNEKIIETKVDKIVLKYGGLYIKLNCNSMYETSCNSIGKTVFLTREEAEAELERRNK